MIKVIKAIQVSFDQKVRQQIKQQLLHCLHYQILPKKLKIFAQKMVDGNEIVKNENLVYLESQTANHLCIRSKRESANITSNQLIRSNNYQYQLSFFHSDLKWPLLYLAENTCCLNKITPCPFINYFIIQSCCQKPYFPVSPFIIYFSNCIIHIDLSRSPSSGYVELG